MRLSLSAAHKATRSVLICQQKSLFHGGFELSPIELSKWSHQYATNFGTVSGTETSYRLMNKGNKHENTDDYSNEVDLEITSRETIKPSTPTPHHLRNYNLSIFDQWFHDCYTPLILFFPNSNKASVENGVKNLKERLSEILTRFYPLAGEVKDCLRIECNDKGVNFVEARVKQSLKEFLTRPDNENLRELFPKSPVTLESSIGNYIISVQVNVFNCGGIGLSMSISHKIIDGNTYFLFMKAWAAAVRGSSEIISPSFVASEVFPTNPSLHYSWPSKFTSKESVSTKRFVFNSTAMASLKAQKVACTSSSTSKSAPTRTEATTALIWKAAAKATSTIRPFGPQSPHALLSYVNFRKRASPPLPYESIGNLLRTATGICFPESEPDLSSLMGEIRESIAKINSDHIKSLKGEKGHKEFSRILRKLEDLTDMTKQGDHCLFVSSVLNSGIHDLDLGWGKPIWFHVMNNGFSRLVTLTDTFKGGGVEATITLKSDEMEIFERDSELLSYATVNPSPL